MQTNNPEYEHEQIINNKEENHDINDNNEQNESNHSAMIEHENIVQQKLRFNIRSNEDEEEDIINNNNNNNNNNSNSKGFDLLNQIITTKSFEDTNCIGQLPNTNDSFDQRIEELRNKITHKTLLNNNPSSTNNIQIANLYQDKSNTNRIRHISPNCNSKLGELLSMFTNHQSNPSIKPTKPHEQKQLFQNYQPFVKKNKALYINNQDEKKNNNNINKYNPIINNGLNINYDFGKTETNQNDFWKMYQNRKQKERTFNKDYYHSHLNNFGNRLFGKMEMNQNENNTQINDNSINYNNNNLRSNRFNRLNLYI